MSRQRGYRARRDRQSVTQDRLAIVRDLAKMSV
jgi:hypothetical protein